ncbi:MAG: non-ribosomal peptide synthetase, partial [Phaeodactylibacter sp.]|nr:non-ribosomal peptide synthetase [Phaeodactylibacter sp.]
MKEELSPAKKALLAQWLKGRAQTQQQHIPKRPADSPLVLSFPQQRQLFLEMLDRGTAVNNLTVLLELKGKLEFEAFEASANAIVARHEALRMRFSFGLGMPVPEVLAPFELEIPIVDLREEAGDEQEAIARRLAEEAVRQPFDLSRAPLIRLKLYQLSADRNWLLLVIHHTIADGWSLGVFLKELLQNYQAIGAGHSATSPALAIQYADFAHWQIDAARAKTFEPALAYWKGQLAGELPVLDLPTDRQRDARQTFSGGT